jgi:16S rRNA pseudouridine516 synthase
MEDPGCHFVLHKPAFVLSSTTDETGANRKTVYEIVASTPGFPGRASCVGRLDYETSGLLLFTSDGNLNLKVRGGGVEKVYHAIMAGKLAETDPKFLRLLEHDETGDMRGAERAKILHSYQMDQMVEEDWQIASREGLGRTIEQCNYKAYGGWLTKVEIVLNQGKFHQVRRLITRSNLKLRHLSRQSIGPLHLMDLPVGECRMLTKEELRDLWAENSN